MTAAPPLIGAAVVGAPFRHMVRHLLAAYCSDHFLSSVGAWSVPTGRINASRFIVSTGRRLGDSGVGENGVRANGVRASSRSADRGRDGPLIWAAPPSEPDWRVSRIRLSG